MNVQTFLIFRRDILVQNILPKVNTPGAPKNEGDFGDLHRPLSNWYEYTSKYLFGTPTYRINRKESHRLERFSETSLTEIRGGW